MNEQAVKNRKDSTVKKAKKGKPKFKVT